METKICTQCKSEFPKNNEYFYMFNKKYKNKKGDIVIHSSFSSMCRECKKTFNPSWKRRNKDNRRKSDARYYKKNKDKLKAYSTEYCRENKDKIKKYRDKNKAKLNEKSKFLNEKYRDELIDCYVNNIYRRSNKTNLHPTLIPIKRELIKITRLIKEKQNGKCN